MNKIVKIILVVFMFGLMIISTIGFASALVIDSVSMVSEIEPGETNKITIKLKNDGSEDIEDVNILLDLVNVPFAPFGSASEDSFDEIKEDKTKYAEFDIITLNNAKSGVYKIPLTITYIELGEKKIKNSLISIIVDSKPIIDVNLVEGLLLKNKNNEFLITITNKGLSDVKFLEVEIGTLNYFSLLSSKKQYIGSIDSDDFDSIKVRGFFKKEILDSVELPIIVKYKDDLSNEYVENFKISLKVYSEGNAVKLGLMEKSYTFFYFIGIFLIIILYIFYKKLRKKTHSKID